jgi:hypothetical protein
MTLYCDGYIIGFFFTTGIYFGSIIGYFVTREFLDKRNKRRGLHDGHGRVEEEK